MTIPETIPPVSWQPYAVGWVPVYPQSYDVAPQFGGGGGGGIAGSGAYAYIVSNGAGQYQAYLASANTQIGSTSDFATVTNAALTAAATAGGGFVEVRAYGAIPVISPIVIPANCGLKGPGYNYNRLSETLEGTFLQNSGMTGTTNAVIKIGSTGVSTQGVAIWDLGIDGGGTGGVACVHATNATDLTCMRVAFTNGYIGLWLDGTLTGASGGEGAELQGCFWRNFENEALRVEPGSGVTDGHVIGGSFNTSGQGGTTPIITIGAGGWLFNNAHITGSSVNSLLVSVQGSPTVFGTCYFDTATASGGYLLDTTGGSATTVTGCYFVQPSGGAPTGCIKFGQLKGIIVGNRYLTVSGVPFCRYSASASTGYIPSTFDGVIANNMGTGEVPVMDNAGVPLIDGQTTSTSYIGQNRNY